MIIRRTLIVISAVIVAAGLTGCDGMNMNPFAKGDQVKQLTADLEAARGEAETAKKDAADAKKKLAAQQKRIDTLMALGPDRLKKLHYPTKLTLGQYTGGADLDAQPGDDGIKVYLRPIDANGDTIKSAGSVAIQMYDLALAPTKTLIGEYKWNTEQTAKSFTGGFMAYHYTFVCPWKPTPPANSEITIRVEFTDYLTGKTLTVQKLCKVDLPATER
ncbi:MAG: hypothetical protein HN350_12355 [Phycisphaerales bacterium]|jgi:hypothetical protein|nr:hypothetical protein [Phycisphaerales bacterium]